MKTHSSKAFFGTGRFYLEQGFKCGLFDERKNLNLSPEETTMLEIVMRTVKLRQQRALLLGYESHAHFALEESMAQTPKTGARFRPGRTTALFLIEQGN